MEYFASPARPVLFPTPPEVRFAHIARAERMLIHQELFALNAILDTTQQRMELAHPAKV